MCVMDKIDEEESCWKQQSDEQQLCTTASRAFGFRDSMHLRHLTL